jgi:hypothetical protein
VRRSPTRFSAPQWEKKPSAPEVVAPPADMMTRVKEFNAGLINPIKNIDQQQEWMDIMKCQPKQVDLAFVSMNACIVWLDVAGALCVYVLLLLGSIFSSDSDANSYFLWEVGFSYGMATLLYLMATGKNKTYAQYAGYVYLAYGAFNLMLVMMYMVLVIPLLFYVPKALFSLFCAKFAFDISGRQPLAAAGGQMH